MPILYMTKVLTPQGEDSQNAWERKSIKTGDVIIIPDGINGISTTITPSGGNAYFQTTTSLLADILAESADVKWADSDAGSSSAQSTDVLNPVKAVRHVIDSGTSELTMEAW